MPLVDARALIAATDLSPARRPRPDRIGRRPRWACRRSARRDPAARRDDGAGQSPPRSRSRAPTRAPCSKAACARSPARCATRSTSTARRGAGERSPSVVLSGPALQIAGFAQALERELGVSVRPQTVGLLASDAAGSASADHLAVAAGLAVEEAPR